jgi:hypothetical protein
VKEEKNGNEEAQGVIEEYEDEVVVEGGKFRSARLSVCQYP